MKPLRNAPREKFAQLIAADELKACDYRQFASSSNSFPSWVPVRRATAVNL